MSRPRFTGGLVHKPSRKRRLLLRQTSLPASPGKPSVPRPGRRRGWRRNLLRSRGRRGTNASFKFQRYREAAGRQFRFGRVLTLGHSLDRDRSRSSEPRTAGSTSYAVAKEFGFIAAPSGRRQWDRQPPSSRAASSALNNGQGKVLRCRPAEIVRLGVLAPRHGVRSSRQGTNSSRNGFPTHAMSIDPGATGHGRDGVRAGRIGLGGGAVGWHSPQPALSVAQAPLRSRGLVVPALIRVAIVPDLPAPAEAAGIPRRTGFDTSWSTRSQNHDHGIILSLMRTVAKTPAPLRSPPPRTDLQPTLLPRAGRHR